MYIFIAPLGIKALFYLPKAVPIPILPCEEYRHQNNASFCLLLCYCCQSYLPVAMQELIVGPCPCPCGVSQLFGALFSPFLWKTIQSIRILYILCWLITYSNNTLTANLAFSERLFAEGKEFLAVGMQIKFVVTKIFFSSVL